MMLSATPPLENNGLFFLLGGGVLVFLFWAWRRAPRRAAGPKAARLLPPASGADREIYNSISELLEQLETYANRIHAQVEAQSGRLERIVADADQRIARLEAVLQQADLLRARWAARAPASQPPAAPPVSPPPSALAENVPPTPSSSEASVEKQVFHSEARRASAGPPSVAAPPDARFQQVYQKADAGQPPVDIAESLGMTLGEVELILNLRGFQN